MSRRCRYAVLALAALLAGAAAAQQGPCSLVDVAQVRAVARGFVPPLAADVPGPLTPTELPGLPATLTIQQCTGAMNAAGAITFRLGLLSAARELSATEWRTVLRVLDAAEPAPAAEAACWRHEQRSKAGVLLHEAGCGQARGRHRLEISVEHHDAAWLPTDAALRALLAQALARLR